MAGTTFRLGTAGLFGKEKTCYDYGTQAKATSEWVHSLVYAEQSEQFEWSALLDQLPAHCTMLGGHFEAQKYVQHFGLHQTITFVQQPLERLVSELIEHKRKGKSSRQSRRGIHRKQFSRRSPDTAAILTYR